MCRSSTHPLGWAQDGGTYRIFALVHFRKLFLRHPREDSGEHLDRLIHPICIKLTGDAGYRGGVQAATQHDAGGLGAAQPAPHCFGEDLSEAFRVGLITRQAQFVVRF